MEGMEKASVVIASQNPTLPVTNEIDHRLQAPSSRDQIHILTNFIYNLIYKRNINIYFETILEWYST